MQIYSIQNYPGKNIYCHKPVIKMVLDIGRYSDIPSNQIEGFNKALLELFPGLNKHYCSLGYEGGFAERLKEGTYMGHIVEHLAIELQQLAGYEVNYGKTRLVSEPSLYYVVFEYANEKCAAECARCAVEIINRIILKRPVDRNEVLSNIGKTAVESELGPSTRAIVIEASARGIPVTRMGTDSLIQLGYGKSSRLVQASMTDHPSCISVDIASNKELTKRLLTENDIPVPNGDIAYTEASAVACAERLGYPVVIKPCDGNQGKGVVLNIRNEEEARAACKEAFKYSKAVIIERFIKGRDYRVLVVGRAVSAVAERRPPTVTGDGEHSVRELLEMENLSLLRGDDHEKPLTRIKLDSIAINLLKRDGRDEEYVPGRGETVVLRENANLSTGGTARDCTDEIHPQNAELAVKAAGIIGLDIAGVDITAEDISLPIDDGGGAVIEVNAAPGLRMHLFPSEGKGRNVTADILDMLYPEGGAFTIPIVSITGTNGKTTTTRLVRHTLALTGLKVGMTSTSGVYIGDQCILKGDNTGPVSARMVLSNREVEAAVLETARGGIVRKGLGYDLADIGIVTNISEDHIGLDSLNSLEDLAYVKSLVIEAVKPEGYAVLNAEDRMTGYMLERVRSKIMLFSAAKNALLEKHMGRGGKAAYVNKGSIYVFNGERHIHIVDLDKVPITMGGIIDCNIENSLAAICALDCLKVPMKAIRCGLSTFRPDISSNPGRFNLFELGDFKVMLDYGHNTAGYKAVIKVMQRMGANRCVGIIGMPGDRPDRSLTEVGKMCGGFFSRVYIKEDEDLRGRKRGEAAEIFYRAVVSGGLKKEGVTVIHSELKALEAALLDAQPGDLIVMFYEKFEPALELINKFKQEIESEVLAPEIAVGQEY